MNNGVNIRLELGIDAQRFIKQVQLNNKQIEEQVAKGITLALDDVCKDDSFVELVRESTKESLRKLVDDCVNSWSLKHEIQQAVERQIGQQISAYAQGVVEKLVKNL